VASLVSLSVRPLLSQCAAKGGSSEFG